jgi:hypothetical protein
MSVQSSLTGAKMSLKNLWQRHSTAIIILILLAVAVSVGRFAADLLGGNTKVTAPNGKEVRVDDLRACTSEGTMFQDMQSATDVISLFKQNVSTVVHERQQYLEKSSAWECDKDPPAPKLTALAARLPGLSIPRTNGTDSMYLAPRPIGFNSFASVLGEYMREYECKLSELQQQSLALVSSGDDIDEPCTETTSSAGTSSSCPPVSGYDVFERTGAYQQRLQEERTIARTALERTFETLRSFETNYAVAVDLVCIQRLSLDLKNEMSLLADSVSCMPKIWDAVTSLHDRAKPKPQ